MKLVSAVFNCLLCDSFNSVVLSEIRPGNTDFPSPMIRRVLGKPASFSLPESIFFPPCPTCSVFLHGVHLREFIANPALEAATPPAVWARRPRMYLATSASGELGGKPPKFRLMAALDALDDRAADDDSDGEGGGATATDAPLRLEFDNFGGGRLRRAPFAPTRRSEFNDALDVKPPVIAHMMSMVDRALAIASQDPDEHKEVFLTLREGRVLERWGDIGYVFEDLVYTHAPS